MQFFSVLPYAYFIKTRLKSKFQKISWVFVYFIPSLLLFYYFNEFSFSINNVFIFILSVFFVNYVYENGYLQNDIILTAREERPTLRLETNVLLNLRENISFVFFVRFVFSLAFILTLYFLYNDFNQFLVYMIMVAFIQALYLIYNSMRNIFNLILILPLSYLRFYAFIIPFVSLDKISEFLFSTILVYPLCKFMELAKEPKYQLFWLSDFIGNIDCFRVKYYLVISVFFLLMYMWFDFDLIYFLISIYYLLFRALSLLLLKNNKAIFLDVSKNSKQHFRK